MSRANLVGIAFVCALSLAATRARAEGPVSTSTTTSANANGGQSASSASALTQTIGVSQSVSVHVRSRGRPVHVTGWSRAEVKITGGAGLSVQVTEDHTRVSVSSERASSGTEPIELSVPSASAVEVRAIGGEVTVADITGTVRVGSVDGSLRIRGTPKQVEVETVSGAVTLDLGTCDVRATSVAGAIRAQCSGKGSRFYGKTVGAPLTVKGPSFERLELRSVSGVVDADTKIVGDGPFELRSHSGSVTLTVPKGTALVVDARSLGRINVRPGSGPLGPLGSAVPGAVTSSPSGQPGMPPGVRTQASIPTVTLRTFSGDVHVIEK